MQLRFTRSSFATTPSTAAAVRTYDDFWPLLSPASTFITTRSLIRRFTGTWSLKRNRGYARCIPPMTTYPLCATATDISNTCYIQKVKSCLIFIDTSTRHQCLTSLYTPHPTLIQTSLQKVLHRASRRSTLAGMVKVSKLTVTTSQFPALTLCENHPRTLCWNDSTLATTSTHSV